MPVKVLSRGLCLPDVAAGDNEIEQHRNFSETHFPGVAPCRFRLVGQDGGAGWDCQKITAGVSFCNNLRKSR